jgi:ABC-2 type transport system ATP-binding protein
MNSPLIITGFSKRYGDFSAVNNLSLKLEQGEVFGFLGPNGAGKSTTIRSILNFISPSKGQITINGLDSVKKSVEIKKHIGYLAGEVALYESLTGNQILTYLSSLGKTNDNAFTSNLASNLDAQMDRPIKYLSKGNKQKIGLIQALMHKPSVLILDEPTSGLDPLIKEVFYEIILDFKKAGTTCFISSHDLSEVQKICDRAAFIREGDLISTQNIKELNSNNYRHYKITFDKKVAIPDLISIPGIQKVSQSNNQIDVIIDGYLNNFLTEILKYNPIDLEEIKDSIEDIYMKFYSTQDNA